MANEDAADVASPRRQPTQKTSSKYDFVKVRVWLADHYYTFSRFLFSRVLTVTQVSYADSLKISLDLAQKEPRGPEPARHHAGRHGGGALQ